MRMRMRHCHDSRIRDAFAILYTQGFGFLRTGRGAAPLLLTFHCGKRSAAACDRTSCSAREQMQDDFTEKDSARRIVNAHDRADHHA